MSGHDEPVTGEDGALRDSDIRPRLQDWLVSAHARSGETEIIHELKVPRPSARIDVAVVNGQLWGFEIKSDVDDLSRLPRQVRSFNSVFDRISVVTTKRNFAAVEKNIPPWWGIALISDKTRMIRTKRRARLNHQRSTYNLLHLLTRAELRTVLNDMKSKRLSGSCRHAQLVDIALDELSDTQIRRRVRAVLKFRHL